MAKTQLKKLHIEKFRALNDVHIELGDHITVVCGKNGTSKSSILGIAAQIFSFEKDYRKNAILSFKQIAGGVFKSRYSEHFRISDKFDPPGSMKVNIDLIDGYTGQPATAGLGFSHRVKSPRPVVRKNSTAPKQPSRNFTHPVIFLSLKRLFPIADRKYSVENFKYLKDHEQEFIALTNELLNRQSSAATGTIGTISSAVSHGDNYDQDSVSAGEDNAGQIILALMSFRKLKEEYPDYKGGLLLIDEADAGLFPTAQENLLRILDRECRELHLQVIMTSHSPTLIERAYEQSQIYRRNYKTVYLSDTYGAVQVMQDWSWAKISADINTKTLAAALNIALPKVNVYCEDKEAHDLLSALLERQPLRKFITPLPDVSTSSSTYISMIKCNVQEFAAKSIVCLDPDVARDTDGKGYKTIVLLPGTLPPDQLLFQYLYDLPADHAYWKNDLQFTRSSLTKAAGRLMSELKITGSTVDLNELTNEYRKLKEGKHKVRELFKEFYRTSDIQLILKHRSRSLNPWKHWIDNHSGATNEFLINFKAAMHGVMGKGYHVDASKLTALEVKLKKV
ncbi:MAG: AAA family ATPase [Flavobacteriales bacterium]